MYIRTLLTVALVLLAVDNPARADWLDDAWSDKTIALHGSPAITVHPDRVSVVLPASALDEALSQRGMTRPEALRAFLGRYSPKCTHVLDLNTARPNLAVELQIQRAASLDDVAAESADEMVQAMESVDIPASKGAGKEGSVKVPHISQVFMTLPERFDFSIDYAPDKIAHCIVPQDSIS